MDERGLRLSPSSAAARVMADGCGDALASEVCEVSIRRLTGVNSPRTSGADSDHVRLLAELDAPLPPVVVHRPTMRVLDGIHRVQAVLMRGGSEVAVRYFDGDEGEAFILAVRLNSMHGKPLSYTERTSAAERIIALRPDWSDRRVAAVTYLSPKSVAAVRRRSTEDDPQSNTRVGRDGRTRPLCPAEGRELAAELLNGDPALPLRQVARQAGISLSTASDVRRRMLDGRDVVPARVRRRADAEPVERRSAQPDSERAADGREPPSADSTPVPLPPTLLESLRKDPSVRLSVPGRHLLRLLSAHPPGPAEWQQLVSGVPRHRAALMAHVAREYADAWARFARSLERKA
ncbi:streptomycin biosynthesis protein [Streptomyces sp. NPDC051576]|uniref:streptomycin biosynthesis protein n=1 Tax=Streptomyces sp. NPDC051576 TaxID=3155803 RepID=UPI00343C7A10